MNENENCECSVTQQTSLKEFRSKLGCEKTLQKNVYCRMLIIMKIFHSFINIYVLPKYVPSPVVITENPWKQTCKVSACGAYSLEVMEDNQ